MSNLAFDTHQFVRDLTKANMPEEQAEVLARHYANLLNDRIATKEDIGLLRSEIKLNEDRLDARITSLEERLDARITSLEERIDARIASLQGRFNARITSLEERFDIFEKNIEQNMLNIALKTQIAGVVITCTVMGLLLSYFN